MVHKEEITEREKTDPSFRLLRILSEKQQITLAIFQSPVTERDVIDINNSLEKIIELQNYSLNPELPIDSIPAK